ncbi:hypothetical protein QBC35DRAFT_434730 [Podospora australis]|uniref:Uncharacterized protein n=1 Tax=Podospora australis TaxID=1536484 RepID=A0AAN6WWU8_9PEZI|nr:hypothetical protein QBC35DRAFT_434730 [Podospora australis]
MSRRALREAAREPIHVANTMLKDPAADRNRLMRDLGHRISREQIGDPGRQMEWRYSGRSESDAPVNEPISAPTDLSTQKSEGFQRFYKAVVSPTHVRVTAGGRIVPNTRGPPSPTAKRGPESNSALENRSLQDKPMAQGNMPLGQIGVNQTIPVVPQFIPGYPPGFQPIQSPVSFVPLSTFGPPPGFQYPQQPINPSVSAAHGLENSQKDIHGPRPADFHVEGRAAEDKQDRLKISPPEYFDYTRPYFYNGQPVIPVSFPPAMGNHLGAVGSPMMPLQMVGFAPQAHLQGHMMSPMSSGPSSAMTGQQYGHYSHQPAAHPSVNPGVPATSTLMAPRVPPISSIKLSEITKKQIAGFKQSLKYHEDQLQYNRHQIDEKEMEAKVANYKELIRQFEVTLKQHLEYEQMLEDQKGEEKNSSQFGSTLSTTDGSTKLVTAKKSDSQLVPREPDSATRRRAAIGRTGINSNMGEGANLVYRGGSSEAQRSFEEVNKRQGLPSEAALAPVFEPRGNPSPIQDNNINGETQDELKNRLLGMADWKLMEVPDAKSKARSSTTPYPQLPAYVDGFGDTGPAAKSGKDTGSGGSVAPSRSTTSSSVRVNVPYLLGTLPRGMDARTAKGEDYVYSRPLTQEEQRARYLYWAKAPKSVMQGLPKYDGKHFYAASPVNEQPASPVLHRTPTARPDTENDFRHTKSDMDPFRPMTPVHGAIGKIMTASEDGGMHRHTRNVSFETQVNVGSDDFVGGTANDDISSAQQPAAVLNSRENSMDTVARLWQAVLKKGPSSSALSATTVQGLLPHYAGHAAASLSPSVSRIKTGSAKEISPIKLSTRCQESTDSGGAMLAPEKRGENCPPSSVSSLEDRFKVMTLEVSDGREMGSTFGV